MINRSINWLIVLSIQFEIVEGTSADDAVEFLSAKRRHQHLRVQRHRSRGGVRSRERESGRLLRHRIVQSLGLSLVVLLDDGRDVFPDARYSREHGNKSLSRGRLRWPALENWSHCMGYGSFQYSLFQRCKLTFFSQKKQFLKKETVMHFLVCANRNTISLSVNQRIITHRLR